MMKQSKNNGIKEKIIGTFILLIISVMILTSLTAWYLNKDTLESMKENDLQREHTILTNFLIQSLFVNNTTEIRKILNLASNQEKFFAVLDSNNSIFLSDYEKLSLVNNINYQNFLKKCKASYFTKKTINKKTYFIYCSPLKSSSLTHQDNDFGILVSFSSLLPFYFSKPFLYFLGLSISILLLTLLWFNKTLNKQLLQPLIALEKLVNQVRETQTHSDPNFLEEEIISTREVHAIKNAFEKAIHDLYEENKKRAEYEKKIIIVDIATSLAHDIRSPIMSMTAIAKELSSEISPQKFKTLEESIQSIRDIANNLLVRYKEPEYFKGEMIPKTQTDDGNQQRHILLSSIIDFIAAQKRYEWQDNAYNFSVHIEEQAKNKWIFASPNDLKRALSNLLNNAYEALETEKNIDLSLLLENNQLVCIIKDTGKGIEALQIDAAIAGKSFKKEGHGLGLSGAKKIIESLGGTLILQSKVNEGTKIKLIFTHLSNPSWFPEKVYLDEKNTIVLDDDLSVHNLWRNISNNLEIDMQHFIEIEKFSTWFDNVKDKENVTFIFDYELNQGPISGLDLLEKINPGTRGYLMTSHAEEIYIQQRCEKAGIWLLPKALFECIDKGVQ